MAGGLGYTPIEIIEKMPIGTVKNTVKNIFCKRVDADVLEGHRVFGQPTPSTSVTLPRLGSGVRFASPAPNGTIKTDA
jgi:hypothetical protein